MNVPETLDKPRISVVKNSHISLKDLAGLASRFRAAMTPHIGRKWRSDQAAAQFGVPLQNIFTTQSVRDNLDRPEYASVDNTLIRIAQGPRDNKGKYLPTLTPYLRFDREALQQYSLESIVEKSTTPAAFHLASARKVLPEQNIQVYLENGLADDEYTMLRLLLENGIQLSHRFVTAEGDVQQREMEQSQNMLSKYVRFQQELVQLLLRGGDSGPEGPMLDNNVQIFQDLFSSLRYQQQQGTLTDPGSAVFFCGPSMITYMHEKDRLALFEQMYAIVQPYFELPSSITIELVPLADLESLCHTGEKVAMQLLPELIATKTQHSELRRQINKAFPTERAALIQETLPIKKVFGEYSKQYRRYLQERSSFFHLDALKSGNRMVSLLDIPELGELTLQDLQSLGRAPDPVTPIL